MVSVSLSLETIEIKFFTSYPFLCKSFIFLLMRLTPKIIRIISIKFCFINFAVCLLNAKVVVEHTYGILSFCANNFPQKLNESDTMQSGLKSLSSLQTFSSKEIQENPYQFFSHLQGVILEGIYHNK